MSDWRQELPRVTAEYAGREAAGLSRQVKRALRRRIARIEASEVQRAMRKQRDRS